MCDWAFLGYVFKTQKKGGNRESNPGGIVPNDES